MRLPVFVQAAFLLCFVGPAGADEKPIQPLEESRELSENVSRDLWRFSIHAGNDKLVMATFTVEPDKEFFTNGLPKAYSIQTIHYVPSGQMSDLVSVTRLIAGERKTKDDPVFRSIYITGLGHALTLSGLEDAGGNQHSANVDVLTTKNVANSLSKTFLFADSATKPTKRLSVTLSLKSISRKKDARWRMFTRRHIELPEMAEHPWSVTLPPVPRNVEQSVTVVQKPISLTPSTIKGHRYHLRYYVLDQPEHDDAPVQLKLRFGRGYVAEDLVPIKAFSLLIEDDVLVKVPTTRMPESFLTKRVEVHTKRLVKQPIEVSVDPGNRVHYLVKFAAPKKLVSKIRLLIDEDGDTVEHQLIVDLGAFIKAEQRSRLTKP